MSFRAKTSGGKFEAKSNKSVFNLLTYIAVKRIFVKRIFKAAKCRKDFPDTTKIDICSLDYIHSSVLLTSARRFFYAVLSEAAIK